MVESNLDISPDYAREKLEYLSLEEESDTDEMGDDTIQEDIIDFKVEGESETRSMLPHAPPPQSQDFKIISKPNETNNLSPETDLHNAIPRAKNIIAFLRALYNEQYFRNIDPNYFVVISDGQLIGIYENEEIARQVAAQTNITVGNQAGDGMVFPISGNFKPKRNSAGRTFDFPT